MNVADCAVVRMRRPDGREYLLRVPAEHLDRLIELAAAEFGGVVGGSGPSP